MSDTAEQTAEMNLDQRAEALLEKLSAPAAPSEEPSEEPANDTEPSEEPKPEPEKQAAKAEPEKPAEKPAEKPDPAAARRERMARIEEMRQAEREKVARSRERRAEEPPAPPPPVLPQTQPQAPTQTGLAVSDEASLFAAAEKLGITPARMADWLARQNDPVKAAEAVIKQHLSPLEQQLAQERAQREALERRLAEREQQAQLAQLVEQGRQIIAGHLKEVADESPLAARLAERAPEKFWKAVDAVCDSLPEGFTAQDVIDQIEEELALFQLADAPQPRSTSATQQQTKKPQQSATVGNRMASERATVAEDDDIPSDLEARAERIKARLRAAG